MKKKVLIVEDEEKIRKIMGIIIKDEQIEIDESPTGTDALEKLKSNKYDLVILDLMIPGVDGFGVLKVIRSSESTMDLPVIIVSSKARDQDILEGLRGGANYYITKPFEPQELVSSIELILGVKY